MTLNNHSTKQPFTARNILLIGIAASTALAGSAFIGFKVAGEMITEAQAVKPAPVQAAKVSNTITVDMRDGQVRTSDGIATEVEIENVKMVRTGKDLVKITGQLVNRSSEAVSIDPLRFKVFNMQNQVIGEFRILGNFSMEPGENRRIRETAKLGDIGDEIINRIQYAGTVAVSASQQTHTSVSYEAPASQETSTPTSYDEVSTSQSEVSETSSHSFSFPLSSCGDAFESGSAWYPVFIDNGDLESIRSYYCNDAQSTVRQDTKVSTVQVASFSSYERAEAFAQAVGGEVGQATYY